MFAVFKKELSIYYLTPFGYVFMGLFLLVSSFIFMFYNLFGGKSDLYGMFGVMNFISIFLFPILTMRMLSEEKRNSTDQLLFTTPITMTSLVLGKYLAALFVFFITLLTTIFFAAFVHVFGNVSLGSIAGSYLGFVLLGASYIAICFFGAALSENQITSVILSFGILALFLLFGFLANIIPITFVKGILKWLALVNKYDELGAGILKVEPLVYYLSFIIIFIVLSIIVLGNKKQNDGRKINLNSILILWKNIFSKQINNLIKIILLFGLIIVSNLIANQMQFSFDMTIDKIYSLSEQSKKTISSLDKPVNIIVFSQDNKKNRLLNILLKEYEKSGKGKINLEYFDADKNPAIVKKYDLKNEGISNGSIIVESGGGTKRIHDFEIIKQNDMGFGKSFEGEALVTGAILYVTGAEFQKVYFLEGHDETSIDDELYKLKNKMENEVHAVEPLNLLKHDAVPSDADVLVVVSPKRDLSIDEKVKIEEYLDKGGRVMLLFDILSPDTNMSNLYSLLNRYGISVKNNFVVEEDADKYFSNNKMYVIPDYTDSVITEKLRSMNIFVMLPFPGNIDISANAGDLTVEPVLKSSDKSWVRYNLLDSAPVKSQNDFDGPANLAVSVVKDNAYEKYKSTKIIIVYNGKFVTDKAIDVQGNYDFFMNSINWLEDKEESITIRPKMVDGNIMMIKGSQYIFLMILTVILMPILIFFTGFIVWRSRKNL